MDQFPGKLYPILDPNSQSKLHENHTLHSSTFPYGPYTAVPPTPTPTHGLLFTLFTKTCSPPPSPTNHTHTHKKFTYSCNHTLKFLVGITVIPRREIKDNGYQAKYWGVNKAHIVVNMKRVNCPQMYPVTITSIFLGTGQNYIQVKLI